MVRQAALTLPSFPRGYHLITRQVLDAAGTLPEKGLIHVFIQHTSAGLTLNENADPGVRRDFETFMNDLVPEDYPRFAVKLPETKTKVSNYEKTNTSYLDYFAFILLHRTRVRKT